MKIKKKSSRWFFFSQRQYYNMTYIMHDFGYRTFITYVNAVKTYHCVWCVRSIRLTRLTESRQGEGLFRFKYIYFFLNPFNARTLFKTSRPNRYRRASLAYCRSGYYTALCGNHRDSIRTKGRRVASVYYYYYIHLTPHTLPYGTNRWRDGM